MTWPVLVQNSGMTPAVWTPYMEACATATEFLYVHEVLARLENFVYWLVCRKPATNKVPPYQMSTLWTEGSRHNSAQS